MSTGVHQIAGGQLRAHDVGRTGAGLLAQPVRGTEALRIDEAVDRDRGDDLPRQPVSRHLVGEAFPQREREVLDQPVFQVGIVGQITGEQFVGHGVLHRGQERRQLGAGHALGVRGSNREFRPQSGPAGLWPPAW